MKYCAAILFYTEAPEIDAIQQSLKTKLNYPFLCLEKYF